ncbi:MAG: cyclodeaminase/cyclohydrolase family protein [Bacillota bacterium]
MTLTEMKVADFLQELASDSPAPGGGSVAALAGSLGAALAEMVARLTKDSPEQTQEIVAKAQALRARLAAAVQEDTEAFNKVMAAFKMPKATPEEKAARTEAIQRAFRGAVEVPLAVMEGCLDTLRLAKTVVDTGNPNALSDAGVAGLVAQTGVRGAYYNVLINLPSIKDAVYVEEVRAKIAHLVQETEGLAAGIHQSVVERLSN